jgi:hypothetical protein
MLASENIEELFDDEEFKSLEMNYDSKIEDVNEKAIALAFFIKRLRSEYALLDLEAEKIKKAKDKISKVEERLMKSVENSMKFLGLNEIKDVNATWKFRNSESVEALELAEKVDINNRFIKTIVEIKGLKDTDYLETIKQKYPETKITAEFDKAGFKKAVSDERAVKFADYVAQGMTKKEAEVEAKRVKSLPNEPNLVITENQKLNLD